MNKKPLTVSIIICTKDRCRDLLETLESISHQTQPPEEILIVDASESDAVRAPLAEWSARHPEIPLRVIPSRPGLTHQRNVGAAEARGDVITFLDDDVLLEPDYLEVIRRLFLDPSVHGATGLDQNANSGSLAGRLYRRFFLLPRMDGMGVVQPSGFPAWKIRPAFLTRVGILPGHNMSYRRVILELFQFNEAMAGYGLMEDVEFSARVGGLFPLMACPRARMIHKRSPVARDRLGAIFRMRTLNHWRIYRTCAHTGKGTLLCYLWACLGTGLWSLSASLRSLDTGPVAGFLQGIRDIRLARKENPSTPSPPLTREGTPK